ncbi:hypothetical protein GCM10009584_18100 [Ornithinimicrobium humiphilum]|uniref:Uncharacterized protein n=1 Tax=Ornithinimicrobium humiphilum TaxID=125288 RepID=A0A543KLE3_9MICO|nr:hypothetical protein [Ornithinimicrobium humiphilum]TQM95902.1 hypothetical protein FB476_0752 [Ornithinimicrobium humiphilum]
MSAQVDERDLTWWFERAASLSWTWARTYAETAPHWYVVLGRTPGLDQDDFVRAARVIETFGRAGQFYGRTYVYLYDDSSGMKWWTMDETPESTTLINMAETRLTYPPRSDGARG